MTQAPLQERAQLAKRALHREEMSRFGHELSWLINVDEIPNQAISGFEGYEQQCSGLSRWMMCKFGEWSGEGHARLGIREAFEKYELPNPVRVSIREAFYDIPHAAYAPGLQTVSEIHGVVPQIAARAGLSRERWPEIAHRSRRFGILLARDTTEVQAIVREYLWGQTETFPDPAGSGFNLSLHRLDPAKLKLDSETGITTVTPIEELISITEELVHRVFARTEATACVGLQAKGPSPDFKNMFEAVWKAFGDYTARRIYPNAVLPQEIPAQASPDDRFRSAAAKLLAKLIVDMHQAEAVS